MNPKSTIQKIVFTLAATLICFNTNAQEEKSTIHLKLEKDGKLIKDTIYKVDKDISIDKIDKILDITLGEDQKIHKVIHHVIEEGDTTLMDKNVRLMIKEIENDEDAKVYISSTDEDGEPRVIVKKIKMDSLKKCDGHSVEKSIIIIKSGDDPDEYRIETDGEEPQWIEKDGRKMLIMDSKDGAKTIKIVTSGEANYNYVTEDGETIIIKTTKDSENDEELNVEVTVEEKGDKTRKK